jgi:hypothetical protein
LFRLCFFDELRLDAAVHSASRAFHFVGGDTPFPGVVQSAKGRSVPRIRLGLLRAHRHCPSGLESECVGRQTAMFSCTMDMQTRWNGRLVGRRFPSAEAGGSLEARSRGPPMGGIDRNGAVGVVCA